MGLVSELAQLSKSRSSAAEHVGEHHDGLVGCRAAAGSGCTRGPETTTGDDGGNGVAEHPISALSASSTSARARGKSFSFIESLPLQSSLVLLLFALMLFSSQSNLGAS